MAGIHQAFWDTDASLIEINPLAVGDDDGLSALDVKMILDDNALFRHPDLEALRDEDDVDPDQVEARRYELNYVRLEGDVGCIVTGAGLGLAAMDLIVQAGGEPANFMDVRPVATRDQVATGFELLLSNPRVKSILVVAMGGGILRCDTIAEGVAQGWKTGGRRVPVVVRAAGTNEEICHAVLHNQDIPVTLAGDLADAAARAVQAARSETA
jgi:succinyl-CoA synthetase beta subunit